MYENGAVVGTGCRRLRNIRVRTTYCRHTMNEAGCRCKQSDARNGEAEVTQAAPSTFVLAARHVIAAAAPLPSSSAVHLCLIHHISAIIITQPHRGSALLNLCFAEVKKAYDW